MGHYYTPQKRWLFFWFDLYRMSGDVIKFDREQEARDFIERFSKSQSEYIEQPILPSDTPKQDD